MKQDRDTPTASRVRMAAAVCRVWRERRRDPEVPRTQKSADVVRRVADTSSEPMLEGPEHRSQKHH